MNTDELGRDLKAAAATWDTPAFDASNLRGRAAARRRRSRRRVASIAAAVVLVGGVAAALVTIDDTSRSAPHAGVAPARGASASPYGGMAPGNPPPVRVTALGGTGRRQVPVMARVVTGTAVTVHARLSFIGTRPAAVRRTAIVVARPGAAADASPDGTGSYYRAERVAISNRVDATSPQHRILNVTTPADLRPGRYPVLSVIRSVAVPGQGRNVLAPSQSTSEIGVIVVTAH